jgi:hypothetical protein
MKNFTFTGLKENKYKHIFKICILDKKIKHTKKTEENVVEFLNIQFFHFKPDVIRVSLHFRNMESDVMPNIPSIVKPFDPDLHISTTRGHLSRATWQPIESFPINFNLLAFGDQLLLIFCVCVYMCLCEKAPSLSLSRSNSVALLSTTLLYCRFCNKYHISVAH